MSWLYRKINTAELLIRQAQNAMTQCCHRDISDHLAIHVLSDLNSAIGYIGTSKQAAWKRLRLVLSPEQLEAFKEEVDVVDAVLGDL